MNFHKGQIFSLVTDDHQTLTYTIRDIEDDGRLLVHSSLLERTYFVSPQAFADFLEITGWEPYRIYFINFGWYSQGRYTTFNQALEATRGYCFDARIELGQMICATWDYFGGLKYTEEYKRWYQDQERELARMQG